MPSNITANHRSPELFDGQAGYFDRRAGLPEECCRDVAKKVIEIGGAGPDHLIVEVGSGTGQIGKWFEAPVIYLGFDLSANMLGEFKHCLDGSRDKLLIQADANANWPIVDGAARIIFSSRAAHLLDPERVASEAFRVAAPSGATLILGRVERAPESIKDRLAIEMDECLRRQGFEGRRGHRKNQGLAQSCCQRGARILGPVTVAKWRVLASPKQSLDSWRGVTGLGGIPVPAETRSKVLQELEGWATETFGELDREFESEESYVLTSLRLYPAR